MEKEKERGDERIIKNNTKQGEKGIEKGNGGRKCKWSRKNDKNTIKEKKRVQNVMKMKKKKRRKRNRLKVVQTTNKQTTLKIPLSNN